MPRYLIRSDALLFAAAVALMTPAVARANDLFGRTGWYDATGSAPVRALELDHAFIHGEHDVARDGRLVAGAATTEVRRNYLYVQDTDGTQRIPFQSQNDLYSSFEFALRELYRSFPDQFLFVYLFTSFDTNVGAFFYAPEASYDRGIGTGPMDTNGPSPREGFVFMNYWQSFQQIFGQAGQTVVQAQARSVFNQEAGHRWCCFVRAGAEANGGGTDVLLGRDDAHWSYFVETGGSPLEGNHWVMNGNGRFTTATGYQNWRFSPLDLYLMGLIPPEEVPPFLAIQNPVVGTQRDIFGQALNRASPPQIFAPTTVTGTALSIGIDAIVARNGARQPAAGAAPTVYKVIFLMLAGRTTGLSEGQRVQFEGMVDDYAAGFRQATGDRARLDYELMATPKQPIGGACQDSAECDPLEATVCLTIPPVAEGSGLCTRPCSTVTSCPDGWCCQALETQVSVCLPTELCAPPDAGFPETPDAGTTDSGPAACTCDQTTACDKAEDGMSACACDPECTCTCDKSFSCDKTDDGTSACACDPECKAAAEDDRCACVALPTARPSALPAVLLALGLLMIRRRR